MAKTLAAAARAASGSLVTQMGRMHTTRGLGRPRACAAAVMVGTMCPRTVAGPVIHSTVPSASSAASRSILGPSAASSNGTGVGPGVVSPTSALTCSPRSLAGCPCSSGRRIERYSRVCATGLPKS